MTVDEYVAEEIERLQRFKGWWISARLGGNKDLFPEHMEPGEWDEQLRAFEE